MRYKKLTVEEFDGMVRDWNSGLVDERVPLSEVRYDAEKKTVAVGQSTVFGDYDLVGLLTDRGETSLYERIGAPSGWVKSEKCPVDLNQTIVDRLKRDKVDNSLLRFRGENCRAVLSDRYMVYNHLQVWEAVNRAISRTRLSQLSPVVWKPYLDDSMQTWILFDGVVADPDEPMQSYDGGGAGGLKPAIHIKNSEDGTGRIGVRSGLYRSYCDNGVLFGFSSKGEMSAIHLGNNQHLVSARVTMAVGEAVRLAGSGIEEYIKSAHEYLAVGIDEIVEDWGKKYKLADETTAEWRGAVARSVTWGDLVMATSDYAGTLKDPYKQTEFEELSGAMLMANRRKYIEER